MTSNHESLTCAEALERLDAVWMDPLPDEPLDAALSAAWEHVQGCSACWNKLQQHRDSDRRLAELMQDVPLPAGLQERLRNQFETTTTATSTRVRPQAESLRRRARMIVTVASMLVCTAFGLWLWLAMQPKPISVQALTEQTPLDPNGLPAVADFSKLPPLPASWLRVKGLRIVDVPRWLTLPKSKHAVAWIPFEAKFPRQPTIQGVLLAALKTSVLDAPPELIVQPTRVTYTQRSGQPVSAASWSERGTVYVCLVRGEATLLERLLRRTAPTPA